MFVLLEIFFSIIIDVMVEDGKTLLFHLVFSAVCGRVNICAEERRHIG